jgi:hypothetical protein
MGVIRLCVTNIYSKLEINGMINAPTQQTRDHETVGFQGSFEHPFMLQLIVSGDENGPRPSNNIRNRRAGYISGLKCDLKKPSRDKEQNESQG